MNEKVYTAFLQWLPTAIPELKNASPEQLHGMIQEMAQTKEGQEKIAQLLQVMQKQKQMSKVGVAMSPLKYEKGTEKVEAPRREIQYPEDRRLAIRPVYKNQLSFSDDFFYRDYDFGDWKDSNGEFVDDRMQAWLDKKATKEVPTRIKKKQNNYYTRHQTVVDEDGNTSYDLAITPNRDSIIMRWHGVSKPQLVSNQDTFLKMYRKHPLIKKAADAMGIIPDFEEYKVMFKK